MAPITSNQLLALNLPVIVILLSYLWYKRKRIGAPSDPGDKESADKTDASVEINKNSSKPLDIEPKSIEGKSIPLNLEESSLTRSVENNSSEHSSIEGSPNRNFSRSLSAPIPIVLPKALQYTKALNISDEELDQHIEKLKSSVVKTDPFELINQGKVTSSLSPSQKFRSRNSVSSNTIISSEEENFSTEHPASVQSSVVPSKEGNIVQKNSSCEEIERTESVSNQDIVQKTVVEQKIKEIISNQEKAATPNIVFIGQTDSLCDKMTSTSNKEIPDDSKSACIEKVENIEKDLVQKTSAEDVPTNAQEVASSLEDLTTNDDLDETLTENRLNSAEERPSSAEGRTSSAEERPNSVEPVPGASTGAIPKQQKKKKKFRKLNCDLKDLGAKLKETQIQSTDEVHDKPRTEQKSRNDSGCEREDTNPHNSGRQSANESPSDAMMIVSTSLSSLNESEGSNDSGKGCSDVITPPPLTDKPIEENTTKYYEFLLHKSLVGKLIGKRGCFVNLIYTKTNAHVIVKDHPQDNENKICIVEGTKDAINKAMKMIKHRFPKEKLEQFFSHTLPPSQRQEPFLILPAATNLETQISCMVMPNHLFLQQPFHPTYLNFVQMHHFINSLYQTEEVPLVPTPMKENIICVAYTFQSWNRAVILSVDEETQTAYVKAMDFGGFAYVHFSKLKQIRPDLLLLPFQASECFLANIEPVSDEWPAEAYALISELTRGVMLYTHVVDLTEDNIPLVNCQVIRDNQLIWINQELVNHGYARWVNELPQSEVEEQTPEES